MRASSKILSLAEAAAFAGEARRSGRTVVTTNGAFDLLSVPHVRLLESAKAQGDLLIVGVNSDASVRVMKGEKRPILAQSDRLLLVSALACVDAVFLFDDPDPRPWLPVLRPNVHVNSSEYGEECVEADVLREIGARLHLVARDASSPSTSDIIRIIQQRRCS